MPSIDLENGPKEPFCVELLGKRWELERYGDLESLWEAMGEDESTAHELFGDDERLPYWTELWPSSMLLGEWLGRKRQSIEGRRCLDLGCGLGLTALAGASCGGFVLGMDYEWPAVFFARRNSRHNAVNMPSPPMWAQMDWRAPAFIQGAFHCIWGADVMYERRFIEPVAAFLEHTLVDDGIAWIAEPSRALYADFARRMQDAGWRCQKVHSAKTPHVTAPGPPAGVNIWELARQASGNRRSS